MATKKSTSKINLKRLKRYKAPLTVKGVLDRKYTPEELCQLMEVCNGGLRTIQLYYKRWKKTKMSLIDLMETVVPEKDFKIHNHMRSMSHLYQLSDWSELRRRICDALARAILYKQFPYLWKKNGVERLYVDNHETNVGTFCDDADLSHGYRDDCFEYYGKEDCSANKNDILYQLLYDYSQGLQPMEILKLCVEGPDCELDDDDDDDDALYAEIVW